MQLTQSIQLTGKVADNAGNVQHNVTAGNQVNFVNGKATSSNVTAEANGVSKVSYDVNAGDGLHIDDNNKLVANVTDIKQGDNVVINKDNNGVYTVSANNTQASVSTDPNKGITVTPTTNAMVQLTTKSQLMQITIQLL